MDERKVRKDKRAANKVKMQERSKNNCNGNRGKESCRTDG